MLAELTQFSEKASVIMRSGIQFLDFGLALDVRRLEPGEFFVQGSRVSLARLEYDSRTDRYVHPGDPSQKVKSELSVEVEESLRLLDGCWLPVPYLRYPAPLSSGFDVGPTTWARARLISVEPGEDLLGHTHRLTLAFDTNVLDRLPSVAYLAPTPDDVEAGNGFRFAGRAHELGSFCEEGWIAEWIQEIFTEMAPERLRLQPEDVEEEVGRLAHHAHYLNWLATIQAHASPPEIAISPNAPGSGRAPIPVDLVLDVGNSRTCGILIEEHQQQGHGLKNRYELALRDLSEPHRVYAEPFESRVEFAQALLGKEQLAWKSGRRLSFVWPTIARVGPEAARLANTRRGTEGSTGISSPKRYLWDEDRYQPGWRHNVSAVKEEIEPHATGAPFSELIDDRGEPLYLQEPADRLAAFEPYYSRSSLMTFMLAEVLTQALGQINSPGQRMKQGDPEKPRHLRTIILTVPPSMPKPEREIFAGRMRKAMVLVWKALGWHGEDDAPDEGDAPWPPFPEIHAEWDEASCAQVVYLFSESQEHFGGRPEDFFRALRRPQKEAGENRVTIGSIDIGGGTTDLVITDYVLDGGAGANVHIVPEQRFRDGFKVAGDDLLLELLNHTVVPAIADALTEAGLADPRSLLSDLIGSEGGSVQSRTLRQQLALQILYPLGLELLAACERYDPTTRWSRDEQTIGELLASRTPPSSAVLEYFAGGVREAGGSSEFDIRDVPLVVDPGYIHELFLSDELQICKAIRSLSEIVWHYDCDVLLVSGRPSRLPGIQAVLRTLLPLAPDRIVPLHGYRAGVWYPFHRDGRIDDPKTTAAVGAMLCKVGGDRKIPNFSLRSNRFHAYSTVRCIGFMDRNMVLKDEDVYYEDVQLDDPDYMLPDEPFEMRARMVLGFRQFKNPRWAASPLYELDLTESAKKKLAREDTESPGVLLVTLERDRRDPADRFKIRHATTADGRSFRPSDLRLSLNTLPTVGIGETSYWLDTGSVLR